MRTVLLTLLPVAALGCGSGSTTAPVPPGPPSTPPSGGPAPVTDPYELNPAKHVIPNAPVTGRLNGQPFIPDRVELEGRQLTLRQGKDFFADKQIVVFLPNKSGKLSDGLKLTVAPSQKWTDGIPSLHVSVREGMNLPDTKFVNDDYAMTLELGQIERRKLNGKLYLALPDSQRSYLAGTFTVTQKRALDEPPGPEEVPFVQGTVTPAAKKDQQVWAGYVGLPASGGDAISNGAGGIPLGDDGSSGGSRTTSFSPRDAGVRFVKFVPHFDFTNLPPGKYLVYARQKGGPVAWKWVDVAADSQLNTSITLDAATTGTVEVKVPAGFKGQVQLAPTDLGVPDPNGQVAHLVAFSLDLKAEPQAGTATIAHVPAGKYTIYATPGRIASRGTVTVTAGKTAKTELTTEKK